MVCASNTSSMTADQMNTVVVHVTYMLVPTYISFVALSEPATLYEGGGHTRGKTCNGYVCVLHAVGSVFPSCCMQ